MKEDTLFERVQNDARCRMSWKEAQGSNLSIQREVLRQGHVIKARHQEIPLERDTVMVFADDAPLSNWAHPCRYLLHNAHDGELYREVAARFPPYLIAPPETYQVFHEPVVWPVKERLWHIRPPLRIVWPVPVGNRYAVLFSGASNNRHVNDLEFLYRTLIDIYGFPADHIYVLNYDGTVDYSGLPHPVGNWPGDNTPYRMPVHGEGTKSALEAVFDDLGTRLEADDLLLIHTNNHGGHNGESYLCTYSGPDYLASDFAAKLGELPQFRCLIVMMEQCHSGGFNTPIIASSPADRTSVASACCELCNSDGGAEFDPFARDWIAAVNGVDPYGAALAFDPDTDGNACISASEAFDYADAIHVPSDSPVFDAAPVDAGGCHLGQIFSRLRLYYDLVYERLQPWWVKLPDPVFYERVHKELMPRLMEVDKYAQKRSRRLRRDLEPRIEELIKEAMG